MKGKHCDDQGVVVAREGAIRELDQGSDVHQGCEREAHQQPEGVGPQVHHDRLGANNKLCDEECYTRF